MVLLIPEVAFIVLVVLGAIGVVSIILSFLLMGVAAIPIYKIIFKRNNLSKNRVFNYYIFLFVVIINTKVYLYIYCN